MKPCQVIEYNKINIFLEKHAEKEVGILVPDLFLFLKVVYSLISIYFDSPQLETQ